MIPETVIRDIRCVAKFGTFNGETENPIAATYMRRCTHLHAKTGTIIIFTRDIGHHASGWLRNPDYERCLHVSLSFRAPQPEQPDGKLMSPHVMAMLGMRLDLAPFDHALAREWTQALLHPDHHLAWHEPAFSRDGRHNEVHHWRLFCDGGWQPIHPRGEVYSRFAEAGWRTWSEVQGEGAEANWISGE